MLDRREALLGMAAGSIAASASSPAFAKTGANTAANKIGLIDGSFDIEIDQATGAILSITQPNDIAHMNWVSGPENAPWQPIGSGWGLGYADLGSHVLHRSRWQNAEIEQSGPNIMTATYHCGPLKLRVARELKNGRLKESYRFTNDGNSPLPMRGAGKASLAIYTPFNDHYTSAADVLENRCHAHIWTGGSSSWVATFRMGGRGPHLGLVLDHGNLDGYSIQDRDPITLSNTRGTILVHPEIDQLDPGESATISWTLFWHNGWEDFFKQAARHSFQFVQVEASRWVTCTGEFTEIKFRRELQSARLYVDDIPSPLKREVDGWSARLSASGPKERILKLCYGKNLTTKAVVNSVSHFDTLMSARARFITSRQQWQEDGSPRDDAYVVYDNQLDVMVRNDAEADKNDGRERIGMGVFLARWLRQRIDDPNIRASLERYYRFVVERLQRSDGYVLDGINENKKRLYNWPWMMQLHVSMARLMKDDNCWHFAMQTLRSYYAEGGIEFYGIGLPVLEMLKNLAAAGKSTERDEALSLFIRHGDRIIERGTNYPASEVNFEQSIVAPAAIFLLELHLASGDAKWLAAATPHLELLQLFEGKQPDHHLNSIAIRHWDGYWFGKARMWGDTFPHYWSSLNALAWHYLGKATKDARWQARADTVIRGNLSLFTEEGRGSAAHIFPVTVNGRPGQFFDEYANDQDWLFVHHLQMDE